MKIIFIFTILTNLILTDQDVSLFQTLRSHANHWLAKVDAGESIRTVAPLKRKVGPALGLGLGFSAIAYNYAQSPTPEAKKKTLIRDSLVLSGVLMSSVLASVLVNRNGKAFTRNLANSLRKMVGAKPVTGQAHGCGHSHGNLGSLGRIQSLFSSSFHDHGLQGAIDLTVMAGMSILGGALAGLVGDAINREDLGKTGPMKLKEGLFQFLGNITVCTISILAFTKVGKALMEGIWKGAAGYRGRLITSTQKRLQELTRLESAHPALSPTELTESVQQALLKHVGQPDKIIHDIQHSLGHQFHDRWKNSVKGIFQEEYLPKLKKLLAETPVNRHQVHKLLRSFYGAQARQDVLLLQQVPASMESIAHTRNQGFGELMGVVSGVIGGVIGGAYVSNHVNRLLSTAFGFPESHEMTGLFEHHSDHGGSHLHGTPQAHQHNKGALRSLVGEERGIRWFDGIMHLDDAPSVLYMAGVHAIESMIQVLYGMSGFLAGTAGVNYLKAPSAEQTLQPTDLSRQASYQVVNHVHPYPVQTSPLTHPPIFHYWQAASTVNRSYPSVYTPVAYSGVGS